MIDFLQRTFFCAAILLLTFGIARGTIITADGKITCKHYKHFCFYAELIEVDEIKDDRLDRVGVICPYPRVPFRYHLEGEENGDGLWNDWYELKLRFRHNCTLGGFVYEVEKTFELRNVSLPTIALEFSFKALERGDKVNTIIPE